MKRFLCSLRSDEKANTLALVAAATIPLVGVIGGGLDASRMYLAKSRLQQACDSATLAARKTLAGSQIVAGAIPSDVQDAADDFFDTNFRSGIYGTTNISYQLTAGSATQMNGAATVDVPTTLMKIFGRDKVNIAVTCSAELNLPNIDVMMVLDHSGSMKGSRISGLRDAVFAFYDEVMGVKPAGSRVRIGFVPYSGAVNVGSILMAKDSDYVADAFTYQSREYVMGSPTLSTELLPRNSSQLGSTNDAQYHWNENNEKKFKPRCEAYAGTYDVGDEVWTISNPVWLNNYWTKWKKTQKGACSADISKVKGEYVYKSMNFDTSAFKSTVSNGQKVATPTGTKGADVLSNWNGCIEERATVAATSFDPIPAGALDLDIDLVPNASNPDTQWKPMWPQITYDRGGPNELRTTDDKKTRGYNCPSVSRKLQEYPLAGTARNSDFVNYVNGMTPRGGTMHDIGMLWGARMLSANGILASENATAPNGDSIARHIIFMTDGEMGASPSNTTAYGNYTMDGRFMGFHPSGGSWNENDTIPINNARLEALCERVKNQNITIWVVAFGIKLDVNPKVKGCSTGTQRAFEAADSAQLSARFREIAGSIAELRLTQ